MKNWFNINLIVSLFIIITVFLSSNVLFTAGAVTYFSITNIITIRYFNNQEDDDRSALLMTLIFQALMLLLLAGKIAMLIIKNHL